MVRRQSNGDLSWYQKGAGKITVTQQDPNYAPVAATEDMQVSADLQNEQAENAYLDELANAQSNVDASRPIDRIPPQPLYISVTDPVQNRAGGVVAGVQTKIPWPEPLPVLQPKMVWRSGASAATPEPIVVKG